MWRVALLFAAARGAKLARLSTDDQDGLKEALFGGDCWAVACTDVNDQKTGRDLLAKALDDPVTQSCKGATLACGARLPSGKTSLQRLGISPPQKGHPLIFVAANGEASAVGLREYAVVDEAKNSATPDAGVLAKHLEKAGAPPRMLTLASDGDFKKKCAAKRRSTERISCALVLAL